MLKSNHKHCVEVYNRIWIKSLFLLTALFFCAQITGLTTPSYARDIDPKADEVLKKMSYYLGSKYEYTYKAEIMFDENNPIGMKLQNSAEQKVYVHKPNQIFIEYQSDIGGLKFWYNDSIATLLEFPSTQYSNVKLPSTIDQALKKLQKDYNFSLPLTEFIFVNPYKTLLENVRSGIYVGTSKVFGVVCDHLAFQQQDIDWQLWIETGKNKNPLPRKLVITYKNMPSSPQFIAIIKDWVIDKPITKFVFKPDIPKFAERTDMNAITTTSASFPKTIQSSGIGN